MSDIKLDRKKFNRFFYNIQHIRQLPLIYVLLSKWGVAWIALVFLSFYLGYISFFFVVFLFAILYYIYSKLFDETLKDRENMFLILIIRKYLNIDTEG